LRDYYVIVFPFGRHGYWLVFRLKAAFLNFNIFKGYIKYYFLNMKIMSKNKYLENIEN